MKRKVIFHLVLFLASLPLIEVCDATGGVSNISEVLLAIAKLEGSINARLDDISRRISETEKFTKAVYGKLKKQEELQQQVLKNTFGTTNVQDIANRIKPVAIESFPEERMGTSVPSTVNRRGISGPVSRSRKGVHDRENDSSVSLSNVALAR